MSERKQSILVGGLISSAGIFISKLLSLIYVIPFNSILQTTENASYYSQAYSIYSYLLTVATAGLPFAIATLIAKYASREDYRTCLLVKKISFYTMAAFGFVCMVIMMLSSNAIAQAILPDGCDLDTMRLVVILISLAIFIVPILSSLRGFYQGFKEMQLYSVSQVIEQIARIIFLLSLGAIAVFVFHQDAIWAVYFGVIAASVSALLTIFYIRFKGKRKLEEVKMLAKTQTLKTNARPKEIFRELVYVAIPFLLIAIFGYCDTIINQFNLPTGLKAFGAFPYTDVASTAIFYKATKIIAIPMILAPGFSAAIIPYISSAIEKKNIRLARKYILECVESVIYIAIPVCLAIFVFAKPIMFVLFGNSSTYTSVPLLSDHMVSSLNLETYILKWYALEGLCATICPIFSSIVTSIGLRKQIIFNTFVFAFIKLVTNYFFISWWGIAGMVISSFVAYVAFAGLNIYFIQKRYKVNWKYTLRKILLMLIGATGLLACGWVFSLIGWSEYVGSRGVGFVLLAVMGLTSCLVYFVITAFCNIPQSIFHFEVSSIFNKIRNKVKR